MLSDIGITEVELYKIVEPGLKMKMYQKYFEQLLLVTDFEVFKKLMIKRNKELEREAIKSLIQIG